jgi:hypothetical protein
MIPKNSFQTVWLYVAICLMGAFVGVRNASGQEESSAIFPGLSPPSAVAPKDNGWHPVVRPTLLESTPSDLRMRGQPPPQNFSQIQNPLTAPPYEQPEGELKPEGGADMPNVSTCPECGSPLEEPARGFCGRCMRPVGQWMHFFSPKRWFYSDSALVAQREPWLRRPFGASLFMGPISGSPLIKDSVEQGTGFLAGARFSYDFDDDWGIETRLASASIPVSGAYRNDGTQHSADHFIWDIDFLYYPWGDSLVRPYLLMGVGIDRIHFGDPQNRWYSRVMVDMPFGVGLKYRFNDWFTFRLELLDNVAFAGGSVIQTQHDFSITLGFEARFGARHVQYWPWNPGMRQ